APHEGDPQVFPLQDSIRPHPPQRRRVVASAPLPAHLLGVLADKLARLLAPLPAVLRAGKPLLRAAIVPRVFAGPPVCREENSLQPYPHARLWARGRKRRGEPLRTPERDLPPLRLTPAGEGLAGPCQPTTPAHRPASAFCEHQIPVLQAGTVAILVVGAGVRARA